MNPQDLKTIVSSGLLSFPVTDFDEQGDFRPWSGWRPMVQRRCLPQGALANFFR